MKTLIHKVFVIIFCAALASSYSWAAVPQPPKLKASAYILKDFHSGKILAEKNVDKRIEPASLTKMMTAYAVEMELKLGNISLEDKVKVSRKARNMGGSRMFLEEGSLVTVDKLLKGLIIQSGNDATIALAEHIAGSEDAFVTLLNAYAQEMGMKNTHFQNSTGMPHHKHYTTVEDLATLSHHVIRDFPEQYALYAQKEFEHNGIKQSNRNQLLWRDSSVDGIKTGHTNSAGFCLAASAIRDGMRLVSVVVGTKTDRARTTESQKLLTYGFRFFETHKLYGANEALTDARIWKGKMEKIPLGIEQDLYVTIPRGRYGDLKATLDIQDRIVAPADEGQNLGKVNISLGKEKFDERELVALRAVPKGGLFRNVMDEVLLVFE